MKLVFLFATLFVLLYEVNCKVNVRNVVVVDNIKQFKKVLKTNTNVLTIYSKDDKSVFNMLKWVEDLAKEIKGKGTIVYINCGENKESKKLCKKYNASPKPKTLKHYKDGEFTKDYDRKETSKSMLNFMLDPTGDAPWEEDPVAKNVVQLHTEKDLVKLRQKEKGQLLIMFYAPWCGYCKKLKPDYAAAAAELEGKAVLAGMDVDKPEAFNVRYQFNITGFPTLIYFEKGEEKFRFSGKHDKQGIIDWLNNPQAESASEEKEEEESWSDQAPEITHLTDDTFEETLKSNPSIVIMFYAPWCGHCKNMKPEYVEAAKQMKEEEIAGTLAAMDCTKQPSTCKKFDVSGYPTVKYFENAEYKFNLNIRTKDKIIEFMKNPEAPPPPPKEDLPWAEVSGPQVLHLKDTSFKDELKKKKHVLVMFYAPWCGHCKKAKPEIETAADHYKEERKVWFAGVDCTVETKTCERYGVKGYPTFRYFFFGKKDFPYNGGRSSDAFIEFMKDPSEKPTEAPAAENEWRDTPSGVVHLEDSDFEDFVKTHASVFVMFYAPWCGHCKSMKPAFTETANELLDKDHVLAAVDCTQNREVAAKYDISGYPTLLHFKDGEHKEYSGGRSKQEIANFLQGNGGNEDVPVSTEPTWADENTDVVHLTSNNFEQFITENPSVLVMFYAPWCGYCKKMKPAFGEAAAQVNTENKVDGSLAALDCTVSKNVCDKYSVRGYPTLIHFKDGQKHLDYDSGREKDDFITFMKNPRSAPPAPVETLWAEENADVSHLNDDTFEDFVQQHDSVLVMFYAPWCGHCKNMKPAYGEAAKVLNDDDKINGKLAAVDCTTNPGLASKYDIKGYPTLKYFKNGQEKMKYQEARTKEALVEFMKKGGARTVQEWKDIPSDVYHLTDDIFEEFVQDHDALVMFYAPWCGHCSAMKPAYMETAKKLKEMNFPAVLAAVDATVEKSTATREGTSGYPTLKFYRNGKVIGKFEEQRTVENLELYIKKMVASDGDSLSPIDDTPFEEIPSSVQHLAVEDFRTLKNIPHVLVFFHKQWCKNCAQIQNQFTQASSRLSGNEIYMFAAVNCETHQDACEQEGVSSYPTIKYYSHGKFAEHFPHQPTVDAFTAYLQRKAKVEL